MENIHFRLFFRYLIEYYLILKNTQILKTKQTNIKKYLNPNIKIIKIIINGKFMKMKFLKMIKFNKNISKMLILLNV